MRWLARVAAAVALAGTVAGAQRPASTDPALEARTRALAAELRCPVCQGLSIQDSPSELAQEMKAVVREQLAAGRTPDEVRRYFTDKYGEWILLEPKATGFNLLVYLLPAVAVLVGVGLLVVVVRRWTAAGPLPTDAGSDPDA